MSDKIVELELKLVHETNPPGGNGAYLFKNLKGEDAWIPKSVAEDYGGGLYGMPEDYALEKELI